MTRIARAFAVAVVALLPAQLAGAVESVKYTYVSAGGKNEGNCPASAPCASFLYAIGQTFAGGQITCLSVGAFILIQITKSITIDCSEAQAYAATPTTQVGGYISINTVATDTVVLRGLSMREPGGNASAAIVFYGAGTVILDRIKATGVRGPSGNDGLLVAPSGPARVVVTDSAFNDSGRTSTGGGIVVRPSGSGTAQVTLERVTVAGNTFGVATDGSQSTGGINMTISDSVLASNVNDGAVATTSSGGAPIGVLLTNVRSTNNGFGVRSIGPNVTVRVKGSDIAGNGTGLAAIGGGALLSAGNNLVQANGSDGSFTGSVPLQ